MAGGTPLSLDGVKKVEKTIVRNGSWLYPIMTQETPKFGATILVATIHLHLKMAADLFSAIFWDDSPCQASFRWRLGGKLMIIHLFKKKKTPRFPKYMFFFLYPVHSYD